MFFTLDSNVENKFSAVKISKLSSSSSELILSVDCIFLIDGLCLRVLRNVKHLG